MGIHLHGNLKRQASPQVVLIRKFKGTSLGQVVLMRVPLPGNSNGQVSVQVSVGDSFAWKFKETGFRVSSLAGGVVHSWGFLYTEI